MKLTAASVLALPVPTDRPQAYFWCEELTGFGVVVGRTGARSYVALGRCRGKKRRVVLGRVGDTPIGVARAEAVQVLAALKRGEDPNATKRKVVPTSNAPANGEPTLRVAMGVHVARMRTKGRAERSITTFEGELTKYLSAWLDRPIAELTGEVLAELHTQIKRDARAKTGANPLNAKGAPIANRVVVHVSSAWNSLNRKLSGALGTWNPAKAVDRDPLKPKRERLVSIADYVARVRSEVRSPIRRDGLLLVLHTGLRHEDAGAIRWTDVDLDAATLHRPDPKGGEARAFTLPLSKSALEILCRRRDQNPKDFGAPDGGFAFPCLNSEGEVAAMRDLREQRKIKGKNVRLPKEDVHTLRRTWESVAHEAGITELDQHVLSNHSYGGHNVNATYIVQHLPHLRLCADKIDAAITREIESSTAPIKSKSRAALSAH